MNWRAVCNGPFLIAAILLAVMLVGLQATLSAIHVVLVKKPVPLRMSLTRIPESFGPYTIFTLPDGEKLKRGPDNTPREMIEELGTDQFITWTYRDTTVPMGQPGCLVQMHVAFYTGIVDTVPHIPEHCTIATGASITETAHPAIALDNPSFTQDSQAQWWAQSANLAPLRPRYRAVYPHGTKVRLPATSLNIRRVLFTAPQRPAFCEFYFFISNGRFLKNAIEVRKASFDLYSTHVYYCKVQITPLRPTEHGLMGLADKELATRLTERFLSYAIPEILICLPDWHEVQAGRYPPETKDETR